MRFELSVALKYLIPRWRSLSVSIISLVSILVISMVVWLVVVFLSVTDGIEKKWIGQLVTFNAPVKVTPTDAYYKSYYYLIDEMSEGGNFANKSLGEKLVASSADPYDPEYDAALPVSFPEPVRGEDGSVRDLAKEMMGAVHGVKGFGVRAKEVEVSYGNLKLTLVRDASTPSYLSQVSYISSFDPANRKIKMVKAEDVDLENLVYQVGEGHALDSLLFNPERGEMPSDPKLGEAILISKSYRKNGVFMGDRGSISYYAPSASGMQEQKLPVYIAGFFDPGMLPVGGNLVLAGPNVTEALRGNLTVPDAMLGNGINVWIDDPKDAEKYKAALQERLEVMGLASFWKVEAFTDFDFSKPILQQLKSDKNLFTLIAIIILLVACSNIVSMLILLVNDKKKEIGVMQSMGASSKSIATIFGVCGAATGLVSSIVGTLAAVFTLHNLKGLIDFLSFLQGHEAFQSAFYGSELPNTLSVQALVFALVATTLISLLAGIAPAIKASRIRPTEILREQ